MLRRTFLAYSLVTTVFGAWAQGYPNRVIQNKAGGGSVVGARGPRSA